MKMKYVQGDLPDIKSMVLEVRIANDEHLLEVFYQDDEWYVIITSTSGSYIRLKWEDFLEIFYKVSLFVHKENQIMLELGDDA